MGRLETDFEAACLRDLIEQKHANDKVLVFTEYKDTAYYIAKGPKKLGVENVAAVVAGDTLIRLRMSSFLAGAQPC